MNSFARGSYRLLFIALVLSMVAGNCSVSAYGGEKEAKHLKELLKSAEKGNTDQQVELATAYLDGKGVEKDPAMAVEWYRKAAERGNPEAEFRIASLYAAGIGVRQDLERAVHWYQLAAASGVVFAKVDLGVAYYHGAGVRKNDSTARALFEEAAEKGIGLAATYLGDMELIDAKTPEDKARAQHWYEVGARLKDPVAAYDLAYMLGQTNEKTRDARKMVELLRMSASKGYVAAKYGLGLMLVEHPEFARGEREARSVLEEASCGGSWKSSMVLAIQARNTEPSVAYFYFYLSALQGGAPAAKLADPALDALTGRLTTQEQAALKQSVETWFKQHPAPLSFVTNADLKAIPFPAASETLAVLQRGNGR
jgi:hypothetical protein